MLQSSILLIWPRQNELCFGCSMNCFASIEGKITKLGFSQNWNKFFCLFFFHWFFSISTHTSSKFLVTSRLIIIMFRPLDKNDQKIPLTLCTKFETLVAPSNFFSKLLKFCMMYYITKINKMRDEEVKNLKLDFSWITLIVWLLMCLNWYLWEVREQFDFLVLKDGEGTQEFKSNCCHFFHLSPWRPSWISKWLPFSACFGLYFIFWTTKWPQNGGNTCVCDTIDWN